MNETQYRLQCYQEILNEYSREIINNPAKYGVLENLRKLNLDYAQKCLALENADFSETTEEDKVGYDATDI